MVSRVKFGFTLIEIVISLAVLAIAMSALIGASHQTLKQEIIRQKKLIAHWIALNHIAEWQLQTDHRKLPRTGEDEWGEFTWRWRISSDQTPNLQLMRYTIEVTANTDQTPSDKMIFYGRIPPNQSTQ